jgi:hypothetical protein
VRPWIDCRSLTMGSTPFVFHRRLLQPLFSVFMSDSDQEASHITFGEVKAEHCCFFL